MSALHKILMILMIFALNSQDVFSQSFEEFSKAEQARFQKHVDDYNSELKEFRDKQNAAYADLLRQSWTREQVTPAIEPPKRPEPPKPKVAPEEKQPSSTIVPVGFVVKSPDNKVVEVPKISLPKPLPAQRPLAGISFEFYGTKAHVSFTSELSFRLKAVDEQAVADLWLQLSDEKYNPLILDCVKYRETLALNDWGYVKFLEKLAFEICTKDNINEVRLLQMFLLIQSGYKARIARCADRLVLLLPFSSELYEFSYLDIKGEKYYVIDKDCKGSFYVFNNKFPNEQRLSLRLQNSPKLDFASSDTRSLTSKKYTSLEIECKTNQNLIDFYSDFPRSSDWSVYSRASISEGIKDVLYPKIRAIIQGKSELEAANIILNFVQTAFEYKTDGEQFGYERPFFADETIYYPYCDCEDRSILFSVLIHELLGLEVVFLEYPQHLVAAVKFTDKPVGDYLNFDGDNFVVCDPTYIGASVGQSMPELKGVAANLIRF